MNPTLINFTICLVLGTALISMCVGLTLTGPTLESPLDRFNWLIGRWESQSEGIVHWPTIPTMRFGEIIEFWPAEVSNQANGMVYINYSAIATSHNSGDHFHNEYGYLTVLPSGFVKFFAIGNNGFGTMEKGYIDFGVLNLESEDIQRIIVARELPTEAIKREFRMEGVSMRQTLHMRTVTHPPHQHSCNYTNSCPFREHATNFYLKTRSLQDLYDEQQAQRRSDQERLLSTQG